MNRAAKCGAEDPRFFLLLNHENSKQAFSIQTKDNFSRRFTHFETGKINHFHINQGVIISFIYI